MKSPGLKPLFVAPFIRGLKAPAPSVKGNGKSKNKGKSNGNGNGRNKGGSKRKGTACLVVPLVLFMDALHVDGHALNT